MKKFYVIIIIFISSLFFQSCIPLVPGPGLSDWRHEIIPGYTIYRVNNFCRELGFTDQDGFNHFLIEGNICEIKYNKDYIAAKDGGFTETGTPTPKVFYLVRTKDNSIEKFKSIEDLENRIKKLKITGMSDWINIYENPWE